MTFTATGKLSWCLRPRSYSQSIAASHFALAIGVSGSRAISYAATWALLFIGLLVMDGVLEVFDPAAAASLRNGARGIGWIFQMGMGYTFYLPFALYMAGLLFWGYAVMKQVSMGRRAGYGLAFMFIAGYALTVIPSNSVRGGGAAVDRQ